MLSLDENNYQTYINIIGLMNHDWIWFIDDHGYLMEMTDGAYELLKNANFKKPRRFIEHLESIVYNIDSSNIDDSFLSDELTKLYNISCSNLKKISEYFNSGESFKDLLLLISVDNSYRIINFLVVRYWMVLSKSLVVILGLQKM